MLVALGMPGLPELIILAVVGLFCVAGPAAIIVAIVLITNKKE